MNDMNRQKEITQLLVDPKADLELMYIGEYLHEKGYSIHELETLPKHYATKLIKAASQYASLKLAELESRARLRTKIQDVTDSQ